MEIKQHEFYLMVWPLPSNLLKTAGGCGVALGAFACDVWCQKFKVCCGVRVKARGCIATASPLPPHTT